MGRFWTAVLLMAAALAQTPPDLRRTLELADGQVLRLSPSAFPDLPKTLRTALQRRGCLVPQVPRRKQPHNVIKGEFSRRGQTDWAILCSAGGVSSILVFWNGSDANPAQIAEAKDLDRLQDSGTGWAYSREISSVDRAYILGHYRTYGGLKPPPIDHKGINDAFAGKGSVVFYLDHEKWLQLTGAD
jgi:hypothetical protein